MTTSKCCKMSNGSEIWLKDRKLHREDGPAIVKAKDNSVAYYVDGVQYSFKTWFKLYGSKHMTEKQLTVFMLKHNIRDFT